MKSIVIIIVEKKVGTLEGVSLMKRRLCVYVYLENNEMKRTTAERVERSF